jgi:DNA-binding IclR family transcriptional regulator
MQRTARVPALAKALDILEFVAASGNAQTVLGLARALAIPQASAFRLVNALIERGYLRRRTDGGGFALGLRVGMFAARALDASGLRQTAQPLARALLQATGQTVEVTALEDDEIHFIDLLESPEPVRYSRTLGAPLIGSTNPVTLVALAHADPARRRRILARMGAVRQAYLKLHPELATFFFSEQWSEAALERVRRRGFAADFGAQTPFVARIAAPLLDASGAVLGTIGIAGPRFRMSSLKQAGRKIAAVLAAAARFREIAGALPAMAPPPSQPLSQPSTQPSKTRQEHRHVKR